MKTQALPGFIGDFNGTIAFINNIKNIFGTIMGTPPPPPEVENLPAYEEFIASLQTDLDDINDDLNNIISQNELSQEVTEQMLAVLNENTSMLSNANYQASKNTYILTSYLPLMLDSLASIDSNIEEILDDVASLMRYSEEILKELDDIEEHLVTIENIVSMNASLIAITEPIQKITGFYSSWVKVLKQFKLNDTQGDNVNSSLLLNTFMSFCKNIGIGGPNDLRCYTIAIHEEITNSNLLNRDGLVETLAYLLGSNNNKEPIYTLYSIFSSLEALTVNAYSMYSYASFALGYDISEDQNELESMLNKQRHSYASLPARYESKQQQPFYTTACWAKAEELTVNPSWEDRMYMEIFPGTEPGGYYYPGYQGPVEFKAEEGYVITSIHFEEGDDYDDNTPMTNMKILIYGQEIDGGQIQGESTFIGILSVNLPFPPFLKYEQGKYFGGVVYSGSPDNYVVGFRFGYSTPPGGSNSWPPGEYPEPEFVIYCDQTNSGTLTGNIVEHKMEYDSEPFEFEADPTLVFHKPFYLSSTLVMPLLGFKASLTPGSNGQLNVELKSISATHYLTSKLETQDSHYNMEGVFIEKKHI